MRRTITFGLFQLRDRKTGKLLPTFYARRDVPSDLRPVVGKAAWIGSTKSTRRSEALAVAERLWTEWGAEIDQLRKLGPGPYASIEAVLDAVSVWREVRCAGAAGLAAEVAAIMAERTRRMVAETARTGVALLFDLPTDPAGREPDGPMRYPPLIWARAYFGRPDNAEKSRTPGLSAAAGIIIGKLQVAAREAEGWRGVPGFDAELDDAVRHGGVAVVIPPGVREAARQPFARAWLEVARHEEAERQRAAAFLAADTAATSTPAGVEVARRPEFEPREGDMTVGEVIEAFKAARGKPDTDKQYGHIFRALREIIGADKPMRALSRQDVRDIQRFLQALPANATKIYPGLPLAVAADRAETDGRKLISPNTVRSYLLNLSAICNWATDEGQLDANPCARQIPSKQDQIKRVGFTREQLEAIFAALADERKADSARFWAPAVLAWTGARANEVAQLHLDDVKVIDGVPYIDLSLFDDDGNRLDRRRLKTEASARAIPLHSCLVDAGFVEFVERQRAKGEERLFPELRPNAFGLYTHELSRWFGRHLDSVGLTEPKYTMHGLRHGFKDSAQDAALPDYILRALAGWGGSRDMLDKYGSRCAPHRVPENAKHIERVTLGGFTLGPPPGLAEAA